MKDAPSPRPRAPGAAPCRTRRTRPASRGRAGPLPPPRWAPSLFRVPTVRREDVPLHEDVRWLAAALGRVIRRLEGAGGVRHDRDAAPRLPRASPWRPDRSIARRAARARSKALSLELSAITARAFTLFFLLINTAEQVHRVRRTRAYRTRGERRAAAGVRASGRCATSSATGTAPPRSSARCSGSTCAPCSPRIPPSPRVARCSASRRASPTRSSRAS